MGANEYQIESKLLYCTLVNYENCHEAFMPIDKKLESNACWNCEIAKKQKEIEVEK